ncbi:MAG: hypothetical protein ACNYPI_08780 [Arenicellales bacterium WSBS_2016_MAG_OTU3]
MAASAFSVATNAAGIQFYKVNKKHQQIGLFNVKDTHKPGCHNFRLKKKIARVGQVGFDYCEVFSKKDCVQASAYAFNWSGKKLKQYKKIKYPTQQVRPGNLWVIKTGLDNHIVRSWRCVSE